MQNIEYTKQIKDYFKVDNNIVIKESLINGSVDQQVFKVLLETKLFEKAIFIQDSMILNKKLEGIDEINLKFIWHFTNHRVHWDIIKEPNTEYNVNNNINSHKLRLMRADEKNINKVYKDNIKYNNIFNIIIL